MRRTFLQLREHILRALLEGPLTINQVACRTGINWRTAKHHLEFLKYRGMAAEVVSSSYVKIYRITEQGGSSFPVKQAVKREALEVEITLNGKSRELEKVEIR
ncbi:ArsR family transcriptional regulator [Candidatus Woesearchaeota archaeon]|nr:ArsR family transcriptional regulator [Candidatus Woesearchaeota archaeon]